jgi:DNA-binding NarL/FixJ family response regulator
VLYRTLDREQLKELKQPHVIYLRRETALQTYGSWAGSMFVHEPARIGFASSQQRLLIAALRGGTDEELAAQLGVSTSAVKKGWQLIYEKAEACNAVLGIQNSNGPELAERGKERKRSLLTYVRAHPEELRPVDMKLVNRTEHFSKRLRIPARSFTC